MWPFVTNRAISELSDVMLHDEKGIVALPATESTLPTKFLFQLAVLCILNRVTTTRFMVKFHAYSH